MTTDDTDRPPDDAAELSDFARRLFGRPEPTTETDDPEPTDPGDDDTSMRDFTRNLFADNDD